MCEVPPSGCRNRWGRSSPNDTRVCTRFVARLRATLNQSGRSDDLLEYRRETAPASTGIRLLRALVVHRDPEAASALVAVLGASNGSASTVAATVLLDPSALATALARDEADAVVCALPPSDPQLDAIRQVCDKTGIALVLTDPGAGRVARAAAGCAAHEP